MSTKPILFNTDMVRAILDGRKTVTRRVVKMPSPATAETVDSVSIKSGVAHFWWSWSKEFVGFDVHAPYHPGDILYVRETWARSMAGTYLYKATDTPLIHNGWHPSIHMPREAARIFLRVTGVRVERLQEITESDMQRECVIARPLQNDFEEFIARKTFALLWDSTIKPVDRAIYGWDSNPWVWVIEFERCEKPEED